MDKFALSTQVTLQEVRKAHFYPKQAKPRLAEAPRALFTSNVPCTLLKGPPSPVAWQSIQYLDSTCALNEARQISKSQIKILEASSIRLALLARSRRPPRLGQSSSSFLKTWTLIVFKSSPPHNFRGIISLTSRTKRSQTNMNRHLSLKTAWPLIPQKTKGPPRFFLFNK